MCWHPEGAGMVVWLWGAAEREQWPHLPRRLIAPSPTSHYLLPDVGLWIVHMDLLSVVSNEVDEPMQGGTAWG